MNVAPLTNMKCLSLLLILTAFTTACTGQFQSVNSGSGSFASGTPPPGPTPTCDAKHKVSATAPFNILDFTVSSLASIDIVNQITSNLPSHSVWAFGSNDGVAITLTMIGTTDSNGTYTWNPCIAPGCPAGHIYVRGWSIKDNAGTVLCTTGNLTVTTLASPPPPTGTSIFDYTPGSGATPLPRAWINLFQNVDVTNVNNGAWENAQFSALQDTFTSKNPALRPSFQSTFNKYLQGVSPTNTHPGCVNPAAPNIIVNTMSKPYKYKQTEFLNWLATNTGRADFLTAKSRANNTYRGDQACPINPADSTLRTTFGDATYIDANSITMVIDNEVNPWRWAGPINEIHHQEQAGQYTVFYTNASKRAQTKQILADTLNGIPTKKLIMEYEIDYESQDLRSKMGETSIWSTYDGSDLSQMLDLMGLVHFNTLLHYAGAGAETYLNARFIPPSIQLSVAVNFRENGTEYRLQDFQLINFNYGYGTIFGPPSQNPNINPYIREGGGTGAVGWHRLETNALTRPDVLAGHGPTILSGGEYYNLSSGDFTQKLKGKFDITNYYKVSHDLQFFPGLPDPHTSEDAIYWAGFGFEVHGPFKVKAKVLKFDIRVED